MEKKNFSPSLQKSPNLKKSQNLSNKNLISLQKSQSPNPITIYPTCFLPLQPHTVALFQYLPSASLSLPQKSPSPKSKNYRKTLINYRISITKMLQSAPVLGLLSFKHSKTAISCHFPWLLTHSHAPCVLSLHLASEKPSKGLKKRKSRRTFLQFHGMKKI